MGRKLLSAACDELASIVHVDSSPLKRRRYLNQEEGVSHQERVGVPGRAFEEITEAYERDMQREG